MTVKSKRKPTMRWFQPSALYAVGMGLVQVVTTATAAPLTAGTPYQRVNEPIAVKPSYATAPARLVRLPEIIADGGGVTIAGRMAPFNGQVLINSTNMVPLTPYQRARSRNGAQACRFTGSFTLKNVGSGDAGVTGFDAYTWVEQPQGPQTGKISDTGYAIPDMKPGATYTQMFSFDLLPGTYVFWLSIDPYHRLKQATPVSAAYHVQITATCGFGGIPRMRVPATLK